MQGDIYVWPNGTQTTVSTLVGGVWRIVREIGGPQETIHIQPGQVMYFTNNYDYTANDYLFLDLRLGEVEQRLGGGLVVPAIGFYNEPYDLHPDTDDSDMYDEDGNLINDEST